MTHCYINTQLIIVLFICLIFIKFRKTVWRLTMALKVGIPPKKLSVVVSQLFIFKYFSWSKYTHSQLSIHNPCLKFTVWLTWVINKSRLISTTLSINHKASLQFHHIIYTILDILFISIYPIFSLGIINLSNILYHKLPLWNW